MEYTKDMVLQLNFGQMGNVKRNNRKLWDKIVDMITSHKLMVTIVSTTAILMVVDFVLLTSFVDLLCKI